VCPSPVNFTFYLLGEHYRLWRQDLQSWRSKRRDRSIDHGRPHGHRWLRPGLGHCGTPPRMCPCTMLRMKCSILFTQLAFIGAEKMWKCGWRSNQPTPNIKNKKGRVDRDERSSLPPINVWLISTLAPTSILPDPPLAWLAAPFRLQPLKFLAAANSLIYHIFTKNSGFDIQPRALPLRGL
jgi:hypothetical protein